MSIGSAWHLVQVLLLRENWTHLYSLQLPNCRFRLKPQSMWSSANEQFRGAGEFKPHICKQVNVEEHTGDQNVQDSTKSCYTFANCSSAAELSPPASGWPQVTTAPPARIAANAKSVCWTSWTPLSCHHYNVNYSKWQQILLHIAMTEHSLNIICTYIIIYYTYLYTPWKITMMYYSYIQICSQQINPPIGVPGYHGLVPRSY